MKILCSWIGDQDLIAADIIPPKGKNKGSSPVLQAIKKISFDRLCLLFNPDPDNPRADKRKPKNMYVAYIDWLKKNSSTEIEFKETKLTSPINHDAIWKAVTSYTKEIIERFPDAKLYFHLTPGTPSMHAVWLLVGRSLYPAEFIQSSEEKGIVLEDIPFDIAVEHYHNYYKRTDKNLENSLSAKAPESAHFDLIIFRSPLMKKAIDLARSISKRNTSVLLEGETGTGKELFARAIHNESLRSGKPFVAINCGAIPTNLLEEELFGHEKGAFTDATERKQGLVETADKGTLFLDEIGELPKQMQVKLLRFLDDNKFRRVGGTEDISVDVRIIAASNRSLISEISNGNFREDLYYRIAVIGISLPPLRDREGDLLYLAEHFIEHINKEFASSEPGYKTKKFSPAAKRTLQEHNWPGNVRELQNTISKILAMPSEDLITEDDVKSAILTREVPREGDIFNRQVGEGFNIQNVIGEVARHYLKIALEKSGGNKSKAARLIGLENHVTFSNWIKKYGVE